MALGNINVSNTMKIEEEINNIVSDKWNNSVTYNVGEYCICKDTLWKCLTQNNNQMPEEGTYWTKVNIGTEIKSVNTKIGNTDISSIGDGTVTSAVSTLDSDLCTNGIGEYSGTKNLWCFGDFVKFENNTGILSFPKPLPSGIYTISAVISSTDTNNGDCGIYYNGGTNNVTIGRSQSTGSRECATINTNGEELKNITIYAGRGWAASHGDTASFTNIQLEAGSVPTQYTPYYPSNTQIYNNLTPLIYPNAGAHNSIYRGKNLGTSYTAEQKAQIQAGTFNDLYIGDYWVIDGVTWRIAHFDYWLNTGDTACTKHHVVIVPDTCLCNAKMNDTNTTVGAYAGSKMNLENMPTAITIIRNAFESGNLLLHRTYLANATTSNSDPTYESAGSWYDSTVELMNECMVYGSLFFNNIEANGVIPHSYTINKSQLALFRLDPSRICNRAIWWLRDVVSAECFAYVNNGGDANYGNASNARGVRPAFGIC